MKNFDQLNRAQRETAIDQAFYELTNHIADGSLDVTLVDPNSQKRLEKILIKCRKEEKPRLIKLHLIHDKPIREELYRLAIVAASGSQYNNDGSPIIGETNETDLDNIAAR